MAESIEAFVKKLQEEGVEAGRRAENQIRAEAEQQARTIVEEANRQAGALVDAARDESEKVRRRAETELDLAVRDAAGRLLETLQQILQTLLYHPVEERLRDSDFLARLIHDVVTRYVDADLSNGEPVTVNIAEDLRPRLSQWALETFRDAAETGKPINLQTTLKEAGFEYRVVDGTVEVTPDSVVEMLMKMVGPELRKLLAAPRQ